VHGSVSVFDNKPYRSPPLVDRTKLVWSDAANTKGTASCGYFVVHKYDRLRVMLFETASVGIADLDLMSMDALWEGEDQRHGSLTDRFNTVECNVRLDGGSDIGTTVYSGEIRLRVSRVPVEAAMKRLQRQANKENEKRARVRASQKRSDERHYNNTYQPCSTM
jgi:ribosome-associated translation inhibitor RaiA